MYNYYELIVTQIIVQKKQRKHDYIINFSVTAMNANHAKTANIKTNVVLRRPKTEPFE